MRLVDLSTGPDYNVADDHLDDRADPDHRSLSTFSRRHMVRLALVQKVSPPPVELRGRNPDPSCDRRDIHSRPASLLNGLHLKFVRPETSQLAGRTLKSIRYRLNHMDHSRASRRRRHRSSQSEKSDACHSVTSITPARWGLLVAYAEVQTMCDSKVKRDGEIVHFQLLIYERGWRSGSIAICERLIHVGGRRLH